MTEQELLNKQGKPLMLALGEVFYGSGHNFGEDSPYPGKYCIKCNRWANMMKENEPCEQFIPLDDWNVAIKWRHWAVEKFSVAYYLCHLKRIYQREEEPDFATDYAFLRWVIEKAQPEHYLKAAALCVLRSENESNN